MKHSGILLRTAVLLVLACLSSSLFAQRKVGYKDNGFTNITQGIAIFPSNIYPTSFGISTSNGYLVNPHLYTGLALGLDIYGQDPFLTGLADFRYYFIDDQFSPCAIVQGGYAYGLDERKGGPLVNAGIGMRFYMTHNSAIQAGLTYRALFLPEQVDIRFNTGKQLISGPALMLGLSF